MKRFSLYTLLLLSASLFMFSCGDDDDEVVTDFEYSMNIASPSADDKNVNDNLHIHVDFASANAETIHHIKVRIYNAADGTEIYNKPDDAHVHQEDGAYTYEDDFMLSNANGVEAHTDWILETKVWAHEAGLAEVVETIQFHVHPE